MDFKLVADGGSVYDKVPVLRPQIKATLCNFMLFSLPNT